MVEASTPPPVRVKICGLTRPEEATAAVDAGVWAVGVVFARDRRRFVPAAQAREVLQAVPPGVLRVGLFSNSSLAVIQRVIGEVPLDLIQLAGHETNADCEALGRERVIKSVVMFDSEDVARVAGYSADWLLVERPREGLPDRAPIVEPALARELAAQRKVILGGGLTPESVADQVAAVRPWAVDVSAGVETADGAKDPVRIREFVAAARGA